MNKLKVLCVDDHRDIRRVATAGLELDLDMDVRSESSGVAALLTAAQWQPDVILLDVMMATTTMDGPATLVHLRKNTRTARIPVIFVTARAQPQDLLRYAGLGATDVIPKPFNPMTLASKVRGMIRQ
jgi:CheY-like chemotaxis protein